MFCSWGRVGWEPQQRSFFRGKPPPPPPPPRTGYAVVLGGAGGRGWWGSRKVCGAVVGEGAPNVSTFRVPCCAGRRPLRSAPCVEGERADDVYQQSHSR